MTLQFTSVNRRQVFQCAIEDRQTIPASETRLVPDSIDVGVLLVERAAKCPACRLIACVSGISKRHEAPITLHQPIAHCPCPGSSVGYDRQSRHPSYWGNYHAWRAAAANFDEVIFAPESSWRSSPSLEKRPVPPAGPPCSVTWSATGLAARSLRWRSFRRRGARPRELDRYGCARGFSARDAPR
jgi:hypothetical protein